MRLHVVDGTYELYRAHFSKRPGHEAPDGRDVKATLGIMAAMLALLQDTNEAVTHLAVAFDNPIRSFRNELCEARGTPFYKSDEGVPPELRSQFDLAEEGIAALGVVVWSMQKFEADDALATAAERFKNENEVEQVRILSPDKDLGQCVDGARVVLVDRMRNKVTDEEAFRANKGIAPRSVPDFLGIVGDTSDGIPGLPGIGERTATLLLGAFPKLEDIPRDTKQWPSGVRGAEKIAATLERFADDARFFRTLATLVEDVPLKESLADLEFRGVPKERFLEFCRRLGGKDLVQRPHRWR